MMSSVSSSTQRSRENPSAQLPPLPPNSSSILNRQGSIHVVATLSISRLSAFKAPVDVRPIRSATVLSSTSDHHRSTRQTFAPSVQNTMFPLFVVDNHDSPLFEELIHLIHCYINRGMFSEAKREISDYKKMLNSLIWDKINATTEIRVLTILSCYIFFIQGNSPEALMELRSIPNTTELSFKLYRKYENLLGLIQFGIHLPFIEKEELKSRVKTMAQSVDLPPPFSFLYFLILGCAYYNLGEDTIAQKFLINSNLCFQNDDSYFLLGKLYLRDNDLINSETCFKKALEITGKSDSFKAEVGRFLHQILEKKRD